MTNDPFWEAYQDLRASAEALGPQVADMLGIRAETVVVTPKGDGSHCGITDLKDDYKALLEQVWGSGIDFETCWSSKKEIWSAFIGRRREGTDVVVTLTAQAECDEGAELIDDALCEVAQGLEMDPDELCAAFGIGDRGDYCDGLTGGMAFTGIKVSEPTFDVFRRFVAEGTETLDDILQQVSEAMDEAEKDSQANFEALQGYIWDDLCGRFEDQQQQQ